MSDTPAIIASGLPGKREEAQRAGITITDFMDGGDDKADRLLIRRLALLALFLLCLTAAFSTLYRFFSRRLEDFTGDAQWIWATHQISRNVPVVFYATRDFDMPVGWKFAHLKIFGDPEYTVWFNGRELAGRRADDEHRLDIYDVSKLARTGKNRIVVGVRSTNGVGGLIAALDMTDEIENSFVTDSSWKIFRRWNDALPLRDIGPAERPMLLGEPPLGRWHYLPPIEQPFDPPVTKVQQPSQAITYVATIPSVRIVEGVAVATQESVRATAYDFNFTRGRVRLSLIGDQPVPPIVRYRLANVPAEFRQIEATTFDAPFGPGEKVVTEPETRSFRYVIVFGGRARAEVVQ